ncbi:MAG: ABC transporter permease [Clostridia bacterium]|nr:ABC transporter permease [Clostridia bacterium]
MLEMLVAIMGNTLRTATPIVLAAMGGQFTEHAGVMNIGMDGMMLIGAFAAVTASYLFASAAMGVLAAILVGLLVGLLFAIFVVKLRSDEFIIGVALNLFAGGLTVFLLRQLFGVAGAFADPGIVGLPNIELGFIKDIPILGKLISGHSLFVYISWIIVFACWIIVYKTPLGMRMRASGEHPESLRSLGISPESMKIIASLLCGVLCGIAGAHLSLGYLTQFTEGMSASRGFIAFACIIFGRANPPKVFLAALFFGFLDALGLRMQFLGISSDITGMMPYLMTVLMMVWMAVGERYKKKRMLKLNKVK